MGEVVFRSRTRSLSLSISKRIGSRGDVPVLSSRDSTTVAEFAVCGFVAVVVLASKELALAPQFVLMVALKRPSVGANSSTRRNLKPSERGRTAEVGRNRCE